MRIKASLQVLVSFITMNRRCEVKRFVTAKIASTAARIAREGSGELILGNVDAKVDWGYAKDYVEAMHLILQADYATDYIVATGEAHTVGEFADIAFKHVGLDCRDHLSVRQQTLCRENSTRIGDSSRLRSQTGWKPTVSFEELVCLMVDAERIKLSENGVSPEDDSFNKLNLN